MFAGSKISSLIGSLRSMASVGETSLDRAMGERPRVTKDEIQALFDLDGPERARMGGLLASERHQRESTTIIRQAMYDAD